MDAHWYMLTVVGEDRRGIVARLSHALYEAGANLGGASMTRLAGNFTIMLMVQFSGSARELDRVVEPVTDSLGLRRHVDPVQGARAPKPVPDVRVTVSGADRAGIVAHITAALAEAGLNILELESDVAGAADRPIYVMVIEGTATEGVEALRSALEAVAEQGVDARIEAIDTLVG